MQSLISLPSEVQVLSADIQQNVAWVTQNADQPIYVWYEWMDWATSFQQNRRAYIWSANAYYSGQKDLNKRGSAGRAARLSVITYVALHDNADTWRWKGVETANETLDNLVQLFAMQNSKEYEIEQRLTMIPRD